MSSAPGPAPADSPPIRVLVVEDDTRFRAAFIAAIEGSADLELLAQAASLQQALSLLSGPAPDVLLVDLGLPDGSGVDLIQAARVAWPATDIMVSSVFGDESHVLRSIEAGAVGYLLKDSEPERVVEQIRSVRAGGSPISPLIARQVLARLRPSTASGETSLSTRETEVLSYITKGFSYDEIVRLLQVSRPTVLTYVRRIYAKLQVSSKTEAVYEARKLGLTRD
ncbi:MAG TPA: response regulator transcription factor [Steroidobacteraceae bacterium]|jgi:DNA-binding NarL/FixJ family response regulator|nr:response regulator transcription factor [Steroidobacteraceae bacterium]